MFSGQASGRRIAGVGGKVTVPAGGAWAIQPPKPPQKPALLRFWLESEEAAERRHASEGPATVWQEIELEQYAEARKEARERYEEAETKSAQLLMKR